MAGSESLLAEFIDGVLAKQDAVRLDLSALAPCIKYRSYPAKSTLLSAGQRWDRLFFIRKGLVRLYYLDAQGKESNKAFFAEGDTLWPVAPRDRAEPVRFNIAMLENTELLECELAPLMGVLVEQGYWERFALPFAEKLIEQKFQREHDFLMLSATRRYDKFVSTNPDIANRIPDYQLASFLGITNVTLSRIRRAINKC
ncbi:Crp/Fnr family transcriptional regulator [Marinobacterium sp. D7]|uniref:Crp/Fnr family transcriptional regulator n=1 Tax=Marinobacterium ramblicola TaxID=2849041 RepID=UPI001C2CF0B0|nr:Crp/Fnr family transcriptional regulator [Marinobacterium ramblicola]MBV1789453.1 Crp/Fnr family transcriptional regulator [Marinobacterium ramblicola]